MLPGSSHKILLLINGGRKPVTEKVRNKLELLMKQHNPNSKVVVSKSLEEASIMLESAKELGFDSVWIGGGDGSLLHAVNVLSESGISLGVIPFGTVNALARSLQIPLNPVLAVEQMLTQGYTFPFDVGCVNKKYLFLCFGSIGFDAMVVNHVKGKLKRVFGRLSYGAIGLKSFISGKRLNEISIKYTVSDGTCFDLNGYSLIFSNVINYAGFPVFKNATPLNGHFDGVIFHHQKANDYIKWLISSSLSNSDAHIKRLKFHQITIRHQGEIYLQLDGDPIDITQNEELHIECLPGKIQFWGIRQG